MTTSTTASAVRSGRIDTHHHFLPPVLRAHIEASGKMEGFGQALPEWSLDAAIAYMDDNAIATGILSPGGQINLGDTPKARRVAREVNEFAAGLVQDRPDRFGSFAALTLPDIEGSIAEACYALDTLHADGVMVFANSGGVYLGDPSVEPLLAELNARKAVVFLHPNMLPGKPIDGIPPFAADFLLDTTRAVIGLTKSGAMTRYPDLKIILSHAGGFVPYAAYRFGIVVGDEKTTDSGIALLKKFYFDTALSTSPSALPSLLAFAEPGHVTFGTDWPWAPLPIIKEFFGRYDAYDLSPSLRHDIDRGSAEHLFPRLAAVKA